MTQDQLLSQLRQLIQALGAIATALGYSSTSIGAWTATALQLAGPAAMVGAYLWSMWARRKTAMVAAVDAMPEVAGVVTKNSQDGYDLAAAVPSATVVPANTNAAAAVAKAG